MQYFFILLVVLFLYMNFWFLISLIKKRNDVADVAWGLGFVVLVWTAYLLSHSLSVRGLLVNILVSIWGLRLVLHIYFRNKGKSEDYRYLAWRKEWGKWFYIRSYLQVYMLQGALLFCVVFPALLVHYSADPDLGFLDLAGVLVWVLGFYFEAVGDLQLARFIKNPANKGKLMMQGLWQYTRHPNYFGEVAQWWGVWLFALSVPFGWAGMVSPLVITFLILKVSGIPLLEKKMEQHPDFLMYKNSTNKFFPWFKK